MRIHRNKHFAIIEVTVEEWVPDSIRIFARHMEMSEREIVNQALFDFFEKHKPTYIEGETA